MTVSLARLHDLAALAPASAPSRTAGPNGGPRLDLARILSDSGIAVHKTKVEPDGRILFVVDCLTSDAHDAGAFFTQFPDGGVAYSCHHESCTGKGWRDVCDRLVLPRPLGNRSAEPSSPEHVGEQDADVVLVPPRTVIVPTMADEAYYGLAGEVVRAIAPTTEADPVAILITFLTMFGSACGRDPHLLVGDSRHGTNVFTVLVGETARSRKGTSQDGPRRLFRIADADWEATRIQGGLSSGEGLIWAVHDAISKYNAKAGEEEMTDPGVSDKRLLCVEEELSQVLKTRQRQGAIISETIRRAWDARTALRTMTKTSPATATDAHISILGHITKAELMREITETDVANGFANRFAWFRVRRTHLLPNPVPLADDVAQALGERIRRALASARNVGVVTRDAEADELWQVAYPELERDRPGLAGAITARSSPITLRFSLIYALLDRSRVIRPEHLEAALAIWDYAEASVSSIFGDLTGDAVADRILMLLQAAGPMARNDFMDAFGRNVPSPRIGHSLDLLRESQLIRTWTEEPEGGRGRRRTVYAARDGREKREKRENT